MKIVLIGATGTIGRLVTAALAPRHEVIGVTPSSGEHHADITDPESIASLFGKLGKVDAIVAAAGRVHLGPLSEMTTEQFRIGIDQKLLGQVNVALVGQHYLTDGGSITLTSGIVSEEPIRNGTNATAVNAAVEGFVRGAAVDLARGIRINVVSPTVLRESAGRFGDAFAGFEPVDGERVALAYVRSVEGAQTGRVYRVW